MKTLLTTILAIMALTASAQLTKEPIEEEVPTVSIVDTIVVQAEKYLIVQQHLDRLLRALQDVEAREKIAGEEVEYQQAVNDFQLGLVQLFKKYETNFYQYDTLQVEIKEDDYFIENASEGLVKQYNELTERINTLQQDSTITFLEAKKEFKKIQAKQQDLRSKFLKVQEKVTK